MKFLEKGIKLWTLDEHFGKSITTVEMLALDWHFNDLGSKYKFFVFTNFNDKT